MSAHSGTLNAAVRPAAVAGQFYPDDPALLRAEVDSYLAAADPPMPPAPKAIIAPHAGYVYSGPIAGSAYRQLATRRESVRRVVLVGPSHFVGFAGLAASSAGAFASPLGPVVVDEEGLAQARAWPQVTTFDAPHRREHSLEVHLPFLQAIFDEFTLVPLVVGDASAHEVAEVLDALWGGEETVIVVSSDLSHYHSYASAQRLDAATAQAIERLDWETLSGEQACGCVPIRGLLRVAQERQLRCRAIDLRNSGDTSGRRDRVVGYGAFVLAS